MFFFGFLHGPTKDLPLALLQTVCTDKNRSTYAVTFCMTMILLGQALQYTRIYGCRPETHFTYALMLFNLYNCNNSFSRKCHTTCGLYSYTRLSPHQCKLGK